MIQEASVEALHAQPVALVTFTEPETPAAIAGTWVGCTEYVQLVVPAADCEKATGWPAIVTDPERATPPFAAARIVTFPLPSPVPPEETVSHGAAGVAVHVHPLTVATVTVRDAPAPGMVVAVGVTENAQGEND